jgi:hypothetical protein
MYRMKRLESGDVLLIRDSDGAEVCRMRHEYSEGMAQALGIGIPVKTAEVTE